MSSEISDVSIDHGTHSGYQQGCRCDPCKKARATYMRKYRKTDHGSERARWEQRMRNRAYVRLAQMFPETFSDCLATEKLLDPWERGRATRHSLVSLQGEED